MRFVGAVGLAPDYLTSKLENTISSHSIRKRDYGVQNLHLKSGSLLVLSTLH